MLKLKINQKKIYLLSLIFFSISLPLSEKLLYSSLIFLVTFWLIEGKFKRKMQILSERKSILIFLSIFLIHIIALLYTKNLNWGFYDLVYIKLPLLIFPIVIGTSPPLKKSDLTLVILTFTITVLLTTLINSFILFGFIKYPISNFRDISIFTHHIKLAIMINISIFSLIYLIFNKSIIRYKWFYILIVCWLILFLFFLKSLTGIIIFTALLIITSIFFSNKVKNRYLKYFLKFYPIPIFIVFIIYIISINNNSFKNIKKINVKELNQKTKYGNYYYHNLNSGQIENGNYVWINVCWNELKEEWRKISNIPFNGLDYKGQEIKYTIIRYLTSKNLTKDKEGLISLKEKDIRNIENGIANHIYKNKYSLYPRIYQILWEIDCYKKGFDYSNSSLILRYISIKTTFDIIKDNLCLGLGLGDFRNKLQDQYRKNKTNLPPKKRITPHNQLITFLAAFGILGLIIILFAFIYPIIYEHKKNIFLFTIIILTFTLAFLSEDTLESFLGNSLVTFFYSIFIFGIK